MDESQNKVRFRFFQSAQSRIFLALALVIALVASAAYIVHWRREIALRQGFASVAGTPGIASIPGAGTPSSAYEKAQTEANVAGAAVAEKAGTAFVPTITRAGFVGDPNEFGQRPGGSTDTKQCGTQKVVVMYKPNAASCTAKNLQTARQTGVTAEELICQGCSCPALKLAGYTAGDLKRIGLSAEQLRICGFDLQALKEAGYSAADLKGAGFTADALKKAGFTAGELRSAGFSAGDLAKAGFTPGEIKEAGFDGSSEGACDPTKLAQERVAGVSVAALKAEGCGVRALKAAGFSAKQLKDAGFSAAELKNGGFSAAQLAGAGFSAKDLKDAGFSADDLKKAGFSAAQLKNVGFSAADLKNAGFSNADLHAAGFSPAVIKAADEASAACNVEKLKKERAAGMSATELRAKGCGLSALKAAGFSAGALRAAGFNAAELKNAGFSASDLKDAGFSATDLKKAGFSAGELKKAGFSAADLKGAGFSAGQLKNAGFSANDLRNAGFSINDLKKAGFSAGELKNAGFSAADLKGAGFSAGQLAAAGYSPKELRTAGFSAAELRRAGVRADEQRDAGAGPEELKGAGYTNGDLLRSGYNAKEAGYHEPEVGSTASVSAAPSAVPRADLLSVNANSPSARLAEFERKQQEEMGDQQRQTRIRQLAAYMTEMSQKLLSAWSNVSTQQLQKAPEEKKTTVAEKADGMSTGVAGATGSAADANKGPIIKAGSVLFAVIDTSINSDENTPIMGRIVTGPLNGSKILGTFSRRHKRLLLTFNVLSIPTYPKSITMNAVAIDPDTARTAISGQVNSHYLLRYGTLFASSFLQGLSDGIMNQGAVRSATCIIGCTTTPSPLNATQVGFVGLGKVGQAYAQHMGQSFNRPPTIRLAAGSGIGLLVMSDLVLPANSLPTATENVE